MSRLSRWLFRKAMVPFVSARAAKQLGRWPAQAPRVRLGTEGLENRDVAGSLIDGFLMAAGGGVTTDPLAIMAGAVGQNALVGVGAAPGAADSPFTVALGTPVASSSDTTAGTTGGSVESGSVTGLPAPVGGSGWVPLNFSGFAPGMFSLTDGGFAGGFPSVWGGVSVGGGGDGLASGSTSGSGSASPPSGGSEGGAAPAGPTGHSDGGDAGASAGTGAAGGSSSGAPLPNVGSGSGGATAGPTGGSGTGGGSHVAFGGGTGGSGEGGGTSGGGSGQGSGTGGQGGGQGGGTGGQGGNGGTTQGGLYLIAADEDEIHRGDEMGFTVTHIDDSPIDPTTETVAWDSNYNGISFQADPTQAGDYATFTFYTLGPRTVAARVTDGSGNVSITTDAITVLPMIPVVTADDLTVDAGATANLAAKVELDPGATIASVTWEESYFGLDYETMEHVTTTPTADGISGSHVFETYGEYMVYLMVTDSNGLVGEVEFAVTVNNVAPTGNLTYVGDNGVINGAVKEGEEVTFTVANLGDDLDVDNHDSFEVWADFDGTNQFELIDNSDWTYDPVSQSITFTHTYDDNKPGDAAYKAQVTVTDDWDAEATSKVDVTVVNVAPSATLSAGVHISTLTSSKQEVWGIRPGEFLRFDNIVEPSDADMSTLTYVWLVDGNPILDEFGDEDNSDVVSMPTYKVGESHMVEAYIRDKDGGESRHEHFKVVDLPDWSPELPVGWVVDGLEFVVPAADRLVDLTDQTDKTLLTGFGPYLNGVYGTFTVNGASPPAEYIPYAQMPTVTESLTEDQAITPVFSFDPKSREFAADSKATVRYRVREEIIDVSEWSLWDPSYEVLSSTFNVYTGTADQSFPITISGLPKDRKVVVTVLPELMKDGQVLRTAPFYQFIGFTPKTPTTLGTVKDIWRIVKELGSQFGQATATLFNSMVTDGFTHILTNLTEGLSGAVDDFFTNIEAYTQQAFFKWLGGDVLPQGLTNFNPLDPNNDIPAFVLQYAGITWDKVQTMLLGEFGSGNIAALTDFTDRFLAGNPDTSDPKTMVTFLSNLAAVPDFGFDWAKLKSDLVTSVTDQITEAVARAVPQVAAMFIPGMGMVRSLYRGLTWVLENRQQLADVFSKIVDSLNQLSGPTPAGFKNALVDVMKGAAPLMISFLASQFGLNKLPAALRKAVSYVPDKIENALRKGIQSLAKTIGGGTTSKEYNGALTQKGKPNDPFSVPGVDGQYTLGVFQVTGGSEVRILKKGAGGDKMVGKPLVASDFTTDAAVAHLNDLKMKAELLRKAAELPNRKATVTADRYRFTNLKTLQGQVEAARQLLIADVIAQACTLLGAGCFAAGTKLWTPDGYRIIEEIKAGHFVYSRDQWDAGGEVSAKVVEEVFERYAGVLHLHAAGQVIRTTHEHPFFVLGRGWVPANQLNPGDRLVCADRTTVAVEEVFDTGEWELVYNLRVAEFHTYFVGADGWGWSAWAHNVTCQEVSAEVFKVTSTNPFSADGFRGMAKRIADNMTAYANNTTTQWRKRNLAFTELDKLPGVGPVTAAKIFWDILLQIGPRFEQAELGVVLTATRLDLMQKALYNHPKPEQQVRIVLRSNSDYYLPGSSAHYFTDQKGRIQRVEFNLQVNSLTNGGNGNTTWMGHLGASGDHGGHLLGRQFNGQNEYPNLVPMAGALNAYPNPASGSPGGGYGQTEDIWATALGQTPQHTPRNVSGVSVTLNYAGHDLRPVSFKLRFTIRNTDFLISFDNSGVALNAQQIQILADAMVAATVP